MAIEKLTKLKHPSWGISYTWHEICDGCNCTISDHGFRNSASKPDVVKAHFCVECLRFAIDAINNTAKKLSGVKSLLCPQ